MTQHELLRYVVGVCDRVGVDYFVTGSVAAGMYGEPRFTIDIDLVADLRDEHVRPFHDAFPPDDFYVSADAIRGALAHRTQFNILDQHSPLKVDVMVPAATDFNRERFRRARDRRPDDDYTARVASPEDVIVMKLVYYEEGGSEKHIRDITSLLRTQGDAIDRAYIQQWADHLGVAGAWRVVLDKLAASGLE